MTNTYGDEIPTTFTESLGYAWFVDVNGYLMCAPSYGMGCADWDNMGEPCDMTEMTKTDVDNIVHDLGLTAWPKMSTMPGEYNRP